MGHVFKNKPKLFSIVLLSIFGVTAITSLVLGAKTLAEPAAFELTNAQIIDKSEGVTGDIVSYDNGDIKSNVALHNLNDKVTYRVSVKNTRDYDITITEIADNNDNTFLNYVYDPHAGFLIASGESFDLDIDVIYANVISDLNERSQDVSVKFTIKYDYEEEELGVPNTGAKPETDKKHGSISLFLISMLGIIVCTFVIKNSNRKSARAEVKATNAKEAKSKVVKADNSKLFIVAGLLMVPLAIATLVQTATAITSSFEFTISTMFDIKDRIEIAYEVNGEPKSEIIPYGGKVEDIDQPQIPGYTFTGWTDDDGNPVDPEAPVFDDTHINPVFVVHHYSIHFNGNEATSGEMQDQQFVYDQTQTLTKNAFAKTGHNFSGWNYLDEDNNIVHYGDEANIENLTTVDNKVIEFVAEWTPITYHIKIDTDDDNTTDIDEELKYGECYTLPTNEAVKIGYTANGWLINGVHYANVAEVCNLTTEDGGEVVVKPDYTVNHYTIHFDGNEATSGTMDDIAAEYDQEYVLPLNTFERTGFEYADWTLDGNIVGDGTTVKNLSAEDGATVTLVARWSKDVYDINYYGLEGATVVGNPTRYDVEQEVILNAPTKTGYVFIGWTGSNGETPMLVAMIPRGSTGAKSFTAHWLPISYTVHFDGNNSDGGSMQDQEFFYDTAQALNTNNFTRTGYTFVGWKDADNTEYTNGQNVKNLTAEDGATVTFVAKWEAHKFTVIFHANCDDATGNMNNQVVVYGEQTSLAKNAYIRGYYEFLGWTTSAEDTSVAYLDEADITNASAEDGAEIHLYAKWRRFDADFGRNSNTLNNTVRNIVAANPNAQTFTKYKDGTPTETQLANATNVSSTIDPTYVWAEGDYMYWWSPDDRPTLRSASELFANATLDTVIFESMDTSNVTSLYWTFAASSVKHVRFKDDFDTSKVTTMSGMFGQNRVIEDIYFGTGFSTENVTSMSWLFTNNAKLTSANIENWDVKKVKDLSNAFAGAKLYEADLSKWDTQSLISIGSAFGGMKHVVFGDKFDTSKVQSMSYAFSGYLGTDLDITMFNTSNVTNMAHMFDGAKISSINLSNFDTSKVTNMAAMFNNCSNLATIDLGSFNTGLVEDMSSMLSGTGLTELDTTPLETGNVTNMQEMLAHNHKLTSLDISNLDTSKATNMYGLFWDNPLIESLDLSSFNMSGVNNIHALIHSMNLLQEITLGEHFTLENITDCGNFRDATNNIRTVYVDEELDTTTLETKGLFGGSQLVGGAGTTTYNVANGAAYNRIDDPDNGKPGYFTIKGARYIRYNGNGADNATPYGAMTSEYLKAGDSLKKNAFVRDGYVFTGWKDADNNKYTDEQVMADLTESKTPLELYAQWKEGTATLTQGWNNTAALKRINADATSFEHWTGETPDFDSINGEENIALSTSNFPVYAWTADNKIYWWSEATTIYMNASSTRMFSGMEKLQSIDISQFDSSLLTGLEGMFENTTALTNINFGDNFQTGNVTNFRDMFSKAKSLTELDLHTWDVSSFNIDLRKVFNGCSSLTSLNLDGWDLSHTTGADDWLAGTNSLQTFSMKGGKLPSNSRYLFQDLKATTINLDNLDTSKATNMSMMFARAAGAIELDLHTWDVSNVQNMYQMFIGSKFTGINISGWQTTSLTNIASIFNGCTNLVNIDLSNIDTSKVEDMQGAFMNVPIATLNISAWHTSKNTSVRTMFSGMTNAETIYVGDGWSTELVTGTNDSATLPLSGMTNKLVGGAGTVWSDDKKDGLTYLHLDDPCDNNPGLFSKKDARYVCYYSNIPEGEANADTKTGDYLMIEGGSLATNTFTRDGYVFTGWKDADNNEYTDEQAMTGLVESKTPLELYAQWRKSTAITTKRYRLMNADGSYPEEYIIESSEEMPMAIATSQTYSKSVEGYQTQSTDSYTMIGEDIVYSLDLPRNQYSLTIQINDEYLMFNDMDHYSNNSITIDDIYWGQNVNLGNYVSITTMDFECLQYHDCKFKEWSQTTGTEGVFSDTSNINSTFTMGKEDTTIYGDGELIGETYSLVYDANGGTGAPDTQVYPEPIAARYISAVSFDISNQIPTRDGYGFWGWGDSATTENPVADNSDKRVDGHGYGDEFYIKQPTTTLYAIWKPVSGSLQSWNGCADMSIGTPIYLLDTRDGQAYEVNKYKMNVDGTETACFTSNLNLGAWELTGDLTSENTNLVTPIAVDADNDGVSDWLDWDYTETSSYGRSSFTEPRFTFQDYFADRPYNTYGDKYGAIYNFAFATANTFNHENTWGSIAGDITADLCPSGWSMPISNEYTQLVTAYGGLAGEMNTETAPTSEEMALILQRDLNFPMSGMFYNPGAIPAEEGYGIYWSKTNPMDGTNMSALGMKITSNSKIVNSDYRIIRGNGASIRCIKR